MFHVKHPLFAEEDGGEQAGGGAQEPESAKTEGPDLNQLAERLDQVAQGQNATQAAMAQFFQQAQAKAKPDDATKQQELEKFFDNPAQAAAQAGYQGAQAFYQQQQQREFPRQVEAARESVRKRDPETWDRYKDEIEAYARQYDAHHWANDECWNQALNNVVVQHMDEIAERKKLARESSGPASPSLKGGKAPKKEDEGMSDEQREVAKIFRMSDADWKKAEGQVKKNRDADVKGRGILDSAYAEFIPFESDDWAQRQRKRANG